MKKILWLCSWYPNKIERYNGDFIQRHAQAASLYNKIHVFNLTPCLSDEGVAIMDTFNSRQYPNLIEQKIYYPKKFTLLGKIRSYYTWLNLYKEAVQKYVKKYGLPDVVHVHVPFKAAVIAQWIKRKYKIPYVVTEHWGGYNNVVKDNYNERPQWFKSLIKDAIKEATVLHTVSDFLGTQIGEMVFSRNYHIIPNTVNTDFFNYEEKEAVGKFKLIHISNAAPVKNTEGILNVFAQLDKNLYECTVIGLPKLMNEKFKIVYPNINFTGVIPYADVAAFLKQQDCLIIFSNIENSPCVITEALCCGVPVIATNVGGIPELVDNTTNGILINPRDEDQLHAAIEEMRTGKDAFNKKQIAENAMAKFNYDIIGAAFDKMYDSVLACD